MSAFTTTITIILSPLHSKQPWYIDAKFMMVVERFSGRDGGGALCPYNPNVTTGREGDKGIVDSSLTHFLAGRWMLKIAETAKTSQYHAHSLAVSL